MTNSQSQIYFTEYGLLKEAMTKDDIIDSKEKIKIDFSVENSSNGYYLIQAKLYEDYEDQVIHYYSEPKESYIKQTLNFEKFFVCDFIFEKQQNIEITLKKNGNEIKFFTTLGYIVGSRDSIVTYKYDVDESLIIKAEKLEKLEDLLDVRFILKGKNLENNYFYNNKFYYFITCKNKKVYKSSLISNDGTFDNIYIPTCILQPNYILSFYNSQKQLIVSFNRTTNDIKMNQKIQLKIPISNKTLYLEDNSEIIKNFSFVDYIKSGVKIALSIGIDFTGSNGHPLDIETLHSIVREDLNDYEKAILSCGNIVGYYDYDQLFPVFGFGAIINSSKTKEASMCFNLNLTDNPEIKSIDNILKVCRDCLKADKLTFSGPTYFAPLIRKVISRINKHDLFEYHILMILTDGIIEDLQSTIDALVDASFLPLSIIIIGIGDEDFKEMEILDGDEVPLVSSTGIKWKRDIVQFVSFSDFKNDLKKLSMEVLAEIPRQIVEYYRFKNLNPIQIKELVSKKLPENNESIINISENATNISNKNFNYNWNIQITNNDTLNKILQLPDNLNSLNDINNLNSINNKNNRPNNNSLNDNNPNNLKIKVLSKICYQNNKLRNNNNSINHKNKNRTNSKYDYDYDQRYSECGDIDNQRNNINNNINKNLSTSLNTLGNQTKKNYNIISNSLNVDSINSKIKKNLIENIQNKNNNTIHLFSINNYSNNIINIYNSGRISNNYNNISNEGSMIKDFDFKKLPLHETKYVSE